MKVIAVANQKGGVGKTTLSFHLSVFLAEKRYRVLAVDMDPQGNLTYTFQVEPEEDFLVHSLFEGKNAEPFRIEFKDNICLDLLGSDIRLSRFETDTRFENFFRLKKYLKGKNYDFVVIDTPPSLGLFTANSLVASDYVVIPVDVSVYSIFGLNDLLETVGKIGEYAGSSPEVLGIVIMGQLRRTIMGKTIASTIKDEYGGLVVGELSHSVKIKEAVSLGKVVWDHSPKNRMAEEFKSILEKILKRALSWGKER